MQLEAIQQYGAKPYEQNEARTAQRNGCKERTLKTHVGEIVMAKPQFRDKSETNHLNPAFLINILV